MTLVPCSSWRNGACERGHFGGRPSAGLCLSRCQDYDGSPEQRLVLQQLAAGGDKLPSPVQAFASCCAVPGMRIVRCCGLLHFGTPKHKRIWRRLRGTLRPEDSLGCGCIARLKLWKVGIVAGIRAANLAYRHIKETTPWQSR